MLHKRGLIERLAKKGYTIKDAGCLIHDMFETIAEILADGESVHIHGFGTFDIKEIAAHEGVSVNTGERVMIPTHRMPRFIPGVALRRRIPEGDAGEE